jgi:acetyltransferase-like isoleucine patch superfamily enzyme
LPIYFFGGFGVDVFTAENSKGVCMTFLRIIPLSLVELIARLGGYVMGLMKPSHAYPTENILRGYYWAKCFGVKKLRIGRNVTLEGTQSIQIGSSVNIGTGTQVIAGSIGFVSIGDGSHVSRMSLLSGGGGISIGKRCMISSHVAIYSVQNNLKTDKPALRPAQHIKVDVGDDVFIGVGAKVLPGVKIGDRAIIGAGAVVIRDVKPSSTVLGIPARSKK